MGRTLWVNVRFYEKESILIKPSKVSGKAEGDISMNDLLPGGIGNAMMK